MGIPVVGGRQEGEESLKEAVLFLQRWLPAPDKSHLPPHFLHAHAASSLATRQRWPWASQVPWVVYLNEVVPPFSLSEPREKFRLNASVVQYFTSLLANHSSSLKTTGDVATLLNSLAWGITDPPIKFESAPPNELNAYSPSEVMARKAASCTGTSVFLVDALRLCGVPARIAGVPHWNRGSATCPLGDASPDCGNHDWVEIFDTLTDTWAFVDVLGDLRLNHSWFYPAMSGMAEPLSINHSIYASSYADPRHLSILDPTSYQRPGQIPSKEGYFPMVWDWSTMSVRAWDVTGVYTGKV